MDVYGVNLVDTVKGTGVAPFFVLSLIHQLPDTSRFRASVQGGEQWAGWGQDRYLLADIFDNLSRLTEVTGRLDKPLPRYPRPKNESPSKKSRLQELHSMFMGGKGIRK